VAPLLQVCEYYLCDFFILLLSRCLIIFCYISEAVVTDIALNIDNGDILKALRVSWEIFPMETVVLGVGLAGGTFKAYNLFYVPWRHDR
jgi:hypothetical protein